MDIFNYIENYGKYTFEEKEFNEVDNVIFSTLSYVNYINIVSSNDNYKMTIKEVSDLYFNNNKINFLEILATRTGVKVLKKISNTNRYKDILVYNYQYVSDNECQFSAVTFDINKKISYVSFEGTDELISGWKEDCIMSYKFPVKAHKYAIDYLNKHFTFKRKKLIVGGHSKGGNLALVSSMYCNFFVKSKIKTIYNNDGQGLRDEEFNSIKYNSIKNKYIHIIPNYSIVGLLLCHDFNYRVITSSKKGMLAHSTSNWLVEDNHFISNNLSKSSTIFEKGFSDWLKKYNYDKRKVFVDSIFILLEENNINSIIEFKKNFSLLFKLIKSSKNIDPLVEEMLKELFSVISTVNKDYVKLN